MYFLFKLGLIVVQDKDPDDMTGDQELYLNIHSVVVTTADQIGNKLWFDLKVYLITTWINNKRLEVLGDEN